MKFIHYLSALVLFASCQQSFSKDACSKNSCPLANINLQSKRVSCCAHVITAADIGTTGFVISSPGQWCLGEDVVYNPSGTNPAITISAAAVENVTLDLNCKTLSQASKDVLGIDGVLIQPGLTNVVIKNGTIRDFSDAGIRAGAIPVTLSSPLLKGDEFFERKKNRVNIKYAQVQKVDHVSIRALPAQLVTELVISDIRAFNNGSTSAIVDPNAVGDGAGGIVLLNAQDVEVINCILDENIFAGLRGFNITKFTMENCHCDDGIATDWLIVGQPTSMGAAFDGTLNDLVFYKSTFNRNTSGGLTGGLGLAFLIPEVTNITNVVVDSCQINDTSATLSDPAVASAVNIAYVSGLEIDRAKNVVINKCQISGASVTLDTPLFDGGEVYCEGIVVNRNTDLSITNCEVAGMTLVLNQPASPSFPAGAINIFLQGISGAHDTNCAISNCLVSNNSFTNNSNVGIGLNNQSFAFYIANQFTISNCHTFGNVSMDSNSPSLLLTEGFDFAIMGNILIEDCSASGHTQAASNPPGEFSQVGGFKADCASTSPCAPVVFRRCTASGNTDTGTLNGFAFGFTTREPVSPGLTSGVSGPFVFDSCIAESNTNSSGTGIGFDLFNLVNSKVINCFAENNNIGINVTDFAPFASNNNIISDNVVSANTAFGIQDLSAGMSNAYYSNRAKNNGPTPVSTNFSGVVFPIPGCPADCVSQNKTPLLYWLLPNAPCDLNTNCIAPTPFDNLCIVN